MVPGVSTDWWWSWRLAYENIQSCIQRWTGCAGAGPAYLIWRYSTSSNLHWESRSRTSSLYKYKEMSSYWKGWYTHYNYKPAAKQTGDHIAMFSVSRRLKVLTGEGRQTNRHLYCSQLGVLCTHSSCHQYISERSNLLPVTYLCEQVLICDPDLTAEASHANITFSSWGLFFNKNNSSESQVSQ